MNGTVINMTIREKLEQHNNDYSNFEPFEDNTPIKSSILIPAYNEPDYLRMTLEQVNKVIKSYNNKLFEVVVVDDGSSEDLESVIENVEIDSKLKYHKFEQNRGRSKARNKAIELAENDLYFFFDSDVIIPENYFENHWKIHNSVNAVAVGLAENVEEDSPKLEEIRNGEVRPSDYKKDFRYYKDLSKWIPDDKEQEFRLLDRTNDFKNWSYNQNIDMWTLPYMVVSHNMSVRKDYVEEVKGFDERFKGWGCEDTFFGAKLIASGLYVIPVKEDTAYRIKHQIRAGSDEERRKQMFDNMKLYEQFIDE